MMYKNKIIKTTTVLLWIISTLCASELTRSPEKNASEETKVDDVLKKLNKKALDLKFYETQIEYKFIQPLLESESLRKGVLYYSKLEGNKSKLRINFQTLKQEDEQEQKYLEEYIALDGSYLTSSGNRFEGTWVVHIDHQIKSAKYYQLTGPIDPNEQADVFDLASRNLPIIGFTKIEDLKKQFEVSLVEQKKGIGEDFTQVHMIVKPNSVYKDDYAYIDFWIDKKLNLPAKVIAVSTEPEAPYGDIYEIKFLKPKVNKRISQKIFEFKIPKDFGEPEIIPLKEKGSVG